MRYNGRRNLNPFNLASMSFVFLPEMLKENISFVSSDEDKID